MNRLGIEKTRQLGSLHRLLTEESQSVGAYRLRSLAILTSWRRERKTKNGRGGVALIRVKPVALFIERGGERTCLQLPKWEHRERASKIGLGLLIFSLFGLLVMAIANARWKKGED
jgi:hypothetical protein